jgi:ditrans,polycis-polyprenyl diphosphate synthase
MDKNDHNVIFKKIAYISFLLRKFLFSILCIGPVPSHIALIMDGNRRFAKRHSLLRDGADPGGGHRVGFKSLISVVQYCYEMGVKCVTLYAFSIDNFSRSSEEVQILMDLIKEKLDVLIAQKSLLMKSDIRINIWGNLELLSEPVRLAAKKVMDMTMHNEGAMLSICVAYTSTSEIAHAIEASVRERRNNGGIHVSDLERNMYTAGCIEPDIIIRTSGETRLSNFLLWQSESTHLQNPDILWPEFSLRHFVSAVLEYQRVHGFLKRLKGETDKYN